MSERFEHRDREAYEYTVRQELTRRRARGCARMLYWTVGLGLLVLLCLGLVFLGAFAG